MRKFVLALAAAGSVFALTAAAAATLTVTGTPPVQGATAANCQTGHQVTTAYTTQTAIGSTEATVTRVTVSGVQAACDGEKMLVKVLNSAGTDLLAAGYVTLTASVEPLVFNFGDSGTLFTTINDAMVPAEKTPVAIPLASAVGTTSVLIAQVITAPALT